jgi:hypothetical protein
MVKVNQIAMPMTTLRDEGPRIALMTAILSATAGWETRDVTFGTTSIARLRIPIRRGPGMTGTNQRTQTTATQGMTGGINSTPQIHLANVVDRAHPNSETLEPRKDMTVSNLHCPKSHCPLTHRHSLINGILYEERIRGHRASTATGRCLVLRKRLGINIACEGNVHGYDEILAHSGKPEIYERNVLEGTMQ